MTASQRDISDLEAILGHTFSHPDVLRRAVTHASMEPRAWNAYERLEFLGDRVLGLVVAEQLLDRFPHEREGEIAKRHVGLVRWEALASVARQIELGSFILMSKGEEEAGARDRDAILSDSMEAVIAALYLDGGLEKARLFILKHWNLLLEQDLSPPQDAKTALQEWAQARRKPLPKYEVLEQSGPAHAPEFTVSVHVQGQGNVSAMGRSKRAAEQEAAGKMLEKVGAL